ncbi:MAG: hypothetical protein U9Q66_03305 [Patescibacteria group bacterium]|nr:hypothetical protein [Patescibacteria group bacterium]
MFNSALITAGSFGIYDFGNFSKLGQYTHFHGHQNDLVNKLITVTQLCDLTHLLLSIFLNLRFSSTQLFSTISLYLLIISTLGIGLDIL